MIFEKVEFKDCIRLIINEGLLKKDRLKYFSINPNQETIVRYQLLLIKNAIKSVTITLPLIML